MPSCGRKLVAIVLVGFVGSNPLLAAAKAKRRNFMSEQFEHPNRYAH